MRLAGAADLLAAGVEETLSYYAFPSEHWRSIRTNNPQERIMREIRRRTRVVGAFPDGRSALMLVAARLRHVAASAWGKRRYLDMSRLKGKRQSNPRVRVAGSALRARFRSARPASWRA